jgi:hypothetical protein
MNEARANADRQANPEATSAADPARQAAGVPVESEVYDHPAQSSLNYSFANRRTFGPEQNLHLRTIKP